MLPLNRICVAAFALAAPWVLNSCNDRPATIQEPETVPLSALALQQSSSPEDCKGIADYMVDTLLDRFTNQRPYYYCAVDFIGPPEVLRSGAVSTQGSPLPSPAESTTGAPSPRSGAGGLAPTSGAADSSAKGPVAGTDTNNQEKGVNEGDIVKRGQDGKLYVLNAGRFHVADVYPGNKPEQEFKVLDTIEFEAFYPQTLYLDDVRDTSNMPKYVVLVGVKTNIWYDKRLPLDIAIADRAFAPPGFYKPKTIAYFINIDDPANLVVDHTMTLDGSFIDGRQIGQRLHLVTSSYVAEPVQLSQDPDFWALVNEYHNLTGNTCRYYGIDVAGLKESLPPVDEAKIAEIKAKIRAKIAAVINENTVQAMLPGIAMDAAAAPTPLACNTIHFPGVHVDLNVQSVTSVNTDGSNAMATGVINNAYTVYSSVSNLYMVQNSGGWWWGDGVTQRYQTAVYQFAIGPDAPQYKAVGRFDGWIKDQFSLSEYNGVLRVASTEQDWRPEVLSLPGWHGTNHLYTMQDNGSGELAIIGKVDSYGKDETIRSVRFLGDKGFVVTFRNIDPLFAFDLKDPANPVLAGEVIIPGFSTYMHPIDESHLLTIGRSANLNGFQLQLFDVSNLAAPKPVLEPPEQIDIGGGGYSYSSAEHDHKAFTYFDKYGLLTIPATVYYDDPMTVYRNFSGIFVYKIDLQANKPIRRLGAVDHGALGKQFFCRGEIVCTNDWYYPQIMPDRSVMQVGEQGEIFLYSLSYVGIMANRIEENATEPLPFLNSLVYEPPVYFPVPVSTAVDTVPAQ